MTLTLERAAAVTFPPVSAFTYTRPAAAPSEMGGTDTLFPFTTPEAVIPAAVAARTEKRLIVGGLLGIVICIEALYFVTLGIAAFSNYVFADWVVK